MMNTNEHIDELIDLYALGALEGLEHERVERHLDQCPSCRAELAQSMQVVDLLAWTPQQYDPPAGSFERLVQRIAPSAAPEVAKPEQPATPAPRTVHVHRPSLGERIRTWLMPQGGLRPAFALALLLVALGLGGRGVLLQQRLTTSAALNASLQAQTREYKQLTALLGDRDTRLIPLSAQDTAQQAAHTQLLVNTTREVAYLAGSNLQQLPQDQVYQLWYIADGKPISAGVFQANQVGETTFVVDTPVPEATELLAGVTIEPAGGSDQPTTTPIFVGKF